MNSKFIPVLLILLLFACNAELENDTRKNFIAVSSDSDDYQKSRDKLDAIIAQNPNHVNALVDRGNLEFDHYDFLDAFSDAARAYRLDSNHFEAKLLYAKALINRHSRTEKDKITAQGHFLELLIITFQVCILYF